MAVENHQTLKGRATRPGLGRRMATRVAQVNSTAQEQTKPRIGALFFKKALFKEFWHVHCVVWSTRRPNAAYLLQAEHGIHVLSAPSSVL